MTRRRRRVAAALLGWSVFGVLAIAGAGWMFGGYGAAFTAIVFGGAVIGTTEVWGRVAENDRAASEARVRLDL